MPDKFLKVAMEKAWDRIYDEIVNNARERLLASDYCGRTIAEWMALITQAEKREFCEKCGGCVMCEPDPDRCEIYEAAHRGEK